MRTLVVTASVPGSLARQPACVAQAAGAAREGGLPPAAAASLLERSRGGASASWLGLGRLWRRLFRERLFGDAAQEEEIRQMLGTSRGQLWRSSLFRVDWEGGWCAG